MNTSQASTFYLSHITRLQKQMEINKHPKKWEGKKSRKKYADSFKNLCQSVLLQGRHWKYIFLLDIRIYVYWEKKKKYILSWSSIYASLSRCSVMQYRMHGMLLKSDKNVPSVNLNVNYKRCKVNNHFQTLKKMG